MRRGGRLRTSGSSRFPKIDFPGGDDRTRLPARRRRRWRREITDKIEEAVNTIAGIDELRSISSEGVRRCSSVRAREGHRRGRAGRARQASTVTRAICPQGIEPPVVSKVDPDAAPILYVACRAERPTSASMTEFADKRVRRAAREHLRRRAGDASSAAASARSTCGSIRCAARATA